MRNFSWFCYYQEAVMNAMNEELPRIQEQVYYGQINSDTDVLDKFLSESGVQRYNPKVHFDHKFTTSNFNCIYVAYHLCYFWWYVSLAKPLRIFDPVDNCRWEGCQTKICVSVCINSGERISTKWHALLAFIWKLVLVSKIKNVNLHLTLKIWSWAFNSAFDDLKPVTHILVVDVTSKKGMKLLHEGIRYLVIFMLQFSNLLVVYVYQSS